MDERRERGREREREREDPPRGRGDGEGAGAFIIDRTHCDTHQMSRNFDTPQGVSWQAVDDGSF